MTVNIELQKKSSFTIIFWMCVAEVLSMQGVFIFSSMLPFFFNEWSLNSVDAGWISGIYYGSYMVSVIVMVSLTDWIDAKKIYILGSLMTILSCVGFALFVEGFWTAIFFRIIGGIGLAGTYMPGLKALSDRLSGTSRIRATSFYTSSFGIGSAISFLLGGFILDLFPWEIAFWIAGFSSILAMIIAWKVLDDLPKNVKKRSILNSLDLRVVFKNFKTLGWISCYSTHNYELFAFRSWVVAYLAFALSDSYKGSFIQPSIIIFIGTILGMPSSVIGNELSMRFGRQRIVFCIMFISAILSILVGYSSNMVIPLMIILILVYGCFVTGESASITSGVIESAEKEFRGATMAVHSSIGFIGSFLGPIGFGIVLNEFGGHNSSEAWFWAFSSTGIILMLGPLLFFLLSLKK